jgi:hyaluronan synthase
LTVVLILIALPLKLYAMFTMNRQGWLTRGPALSSAHLRPSGRLVAAASVVSVASDSR